MRALTPDDVAAAPLRWEAWSPIRGRRLWSSLRAAALWILEVER